MTLMADALPDSAPLVRDLLLQVRAQREAADRAELAILELALEFAHASPALAGQEHAHGPERAAAFSGRTLGFLLLVSGAITLCAGLTAGPLITLMAPGFDRPRHDLAVRLFRLLLVNLPFGALIYFGSLLAIGGFHKDDWSMLRDAMKGALFRAV